MYGEKGYLSGDVTVRENFRTFKVQHWDLGRLKRYNQDEGLITLCFDCGIKGCYSHGSKLAITGKNGSMFCFTGSNIELDKRTEAILEFITSHLHLSLSQLYSSKQLEWSRGALSPREKEVLNWLKQGKSSWDISVILGLAEREWRELIKVFRESMSNYKVPAKEQNEILGIIESTKKDIVVSSEKEAKR